MNVFIFVFSSVILSVLICFLYALYLLTFIKKVGNGSKRMQKIASLIKNGANTYFITQYYYVLIFAVLITILLFFLFNSIITILGFVTSAIFSGLAGFLAMEMSLNGNLKTAEASKKGVPHAFVVSFSVSTISGIIVASLAMICVSVFLFIFINFYFSQVRIVINTLLTIGLGASLISIFTRIGGGIFTKGADVGADLVGKIEKNIPEDDPRNPAVIADNVGDNVGDCAGMAADLFETYILSMVGLLLVAFSIFPDNPEKAYLLGTYSLLIGSISMFALFLGTYLINHLGGDNHNKNSHDIFSVIMKGFSLAIVVFIILNFIFSYIFFNNFQPIINVSTSVNSWNLDIHSNYWINIAICNLVGILVSIGLILTTNYYTSVNYSPVINLAKAAKISTGTCIIEGLSLGKRSVVIPSLIICTGIIVSYYIGQIFGIAVTVNSMLSLCGIIIALDAFGPIVDNAGGIIEMAKEEKKMRQTTDILDTVGNTTKAITKGYAIGSAGLGAIVLLYIFTMEISYFSNNSSVYYWFSSVYEDFSLNNPYVIVGLLLGSMLIFVFCSYSLGAVSKSAEAIVEEVRRQFREEKILSGIKEPDYNKSIALLSDIAIKSMFIPSLIPIFTPILFFLLILFSIGKSAAFSVLGGILIGLIITGLYLAISMTNSGGAWDNAKKLIESGQYGGKNSDAYRSAVTGDTVGDPYKDTAGPAINPMIKVVNIVALLIIAYFALYQ